jgi:hypothetical protein
VHLKKEQIDRLADRILSDLIAEDVVSLKGDQRIIVQSIAEVIRKDIEAEAQLDADAERLLDETLRAAGTTGIDRHKMLKMIKIRLAKERNVVL